MPTAVVRLTASRADVERFSSLAEDTLPLGEVSMSASEAEDGRWQLEIYGPPNVTPDTLSAAVRAAIGHALKDISLDEESIADADWVAASLAGLGPVRAGRFFVHGGHDRDCAPANAVAIQVEAALAFGTGHHGTTRGCLLAFERLMRRTRPFRVLDVGTGTGVLAIAAARVLKRPVLASDIDPIAVRIARENAKLNGVSRGVRTVIAPGFAHPAIAAGAPYDLIFANILAEPLVGVAPALAPCLAAGGHAILSGLLARQERTVRAAYRARGLVLRERIVLEGWATLVLARP